MFQQKFKPRQLGIKSTRLNTHSNNIATIKTTKTNRISKRIFSTLSSTSPLIQSPSHNPLTQQQEQVSPLKQLNEQIKPNRLPPTFLLDGFDSSLPLPPLTSHQAKLRSFPSLEEIKPSKPLSKQELNNLFQDPTLPTSKKLRRQALVNSFPNVFDGTAEMMKKDPFPLRNRWNQHFFQNNNQLVIELGCGRGQYVVGLAKRDRELSQQALPHQNSNYIGIEKKGQRLFVGATELLTHGLPDAAFIRGSFDFVGLMFGKGEVDHLWLTFPDRNFHFNSNRHITSPKYIPLYQSVLSPNGIIHLKTDQDAIFDYTMEQIKHFGHIIHEAHTDLYAYLDASSELPVTSFLNSSSSLLTTPKDVLAIKTLYEERWAKKGKTIKYVKFALNPDLDYRQMFIDSFAGEEFVDDEKRVSEDSESE